MSKMWTRAETVKAVPVDPITVHEYFVLEADGAVVCSPSGVVAGKVKFSKDPAEFEQYEHADEYGAMLLWTHQAVSYRVIKYTRLPE